MLEKMTITKAMQDLRAKKVSAVELARASIEQMEKTEPIVSAVLTQTCENALEQAKEVDAALARGETINNLAGIPMMVKDNFAVKGVKMTAGDKMLENFVPAYDASIISNLREKRAVFMGKSNMDAWAHGTSTENSAYFDTKNPWDPTRIPGGSSGGSAASVASSQVLWALGSDTGGSIRQPAAMCGVVGWKPTYGLTSRQGVVAMASSLDTMGAFAKNVQDMTIIADEIVGKDINDATSLVTESPNYFQNLNESMEGVKIGVPVEYFAKGLNEEVYSSIEDALEIFEDLGAEIYDIALPHTKYAIAAYYIICPSEVSANLARYDGIRFGHKSANETNHIDMFSKARAEGFGDEALRRIMIGTYTLSAGYFDAYYKKAQRVRTLIVKEFEDAFKEVDFIITPTTPHTAFKLGEKSDDPLSLYLEDVYTVSANLAGICGISVPVGFDRKRLPIGMQLLGPQRGEQKIFNAGFAYQNKTNWHNKRPSFPEETE